MLTLINFGSDFATSTLGIAGNLLSDLSPYITLVLGVLLAMIVLAFIIRALIHR